MPKKTTNLTVEDKLSRCPACDYRNGFHVTFKKTAGKGFDVRLRCPDCGAAFDIGWQVSLKSRPKVEADKDGARG